MDNRWGVFDSLNNEYHACFSVYMVLKNRPPQYFQDLKEKNQHFITIKNEKTMANTYSQIYIQTIFAVKRREALIDKSWREDLFRYITGVVQGHGQKILAVGGVEDHVHFFFGYDNLMVKIPDLVRETKKATNKWINDNRLSKHYFEWQD